MKRINSIKIKVTRKKSIEEDYALLNIISDNLIKVQNVKTNKYGIIDKEGTEIVACQYDYLSLVNDNLILVAKNHQYGFIDKEGNKLLPCQYDRAKLVSKELVLVKKDDHYGYIDKDGNEILPCQYDLLETFSEDLAPVAIKYNCHYEKIEGDIFEICDYLWGFIDKKGNEIVPCKYASVKPFSDGMAAVKKDGKWGFVNKYGKEIIPCKYRPVGSFSEGIAAVQKGGYWGFIDKTGKKITSCKYYDVGDFSEGFAAVSGKYNNLKSFIKSDGRVNDYLWGFIDKKGKKIIPCKYSDVGDFSEGMAIVSIADKYGFIDKEGNEVIPPKYYKAWNFKNGIAKVEGYFNGEIYYIDKKGNEINKDLIKTENTASIDNEPIIKINYDKEITEVLYIEEEKQIPNNCLSIEVLGYASLLTLNNGKEIFIEASTREELEEKIQIIISSQIDTLENSIKSTPLVRKLKLDSNNKK